MTKMLAETIKNKDSFKLLVVDDDVSSRRAVRNHLRGLGFKHVRTVEDGYRAMTVLKQEHYDFVISDWDMPRMNGLFLLLAVRNDPRLAGIPLVLMALDVEERRLADLMDREEDGYLVKPFTAETLEKKMVEVIARRPPVSPIEPHLRAADELLARGDFVEAHKRLDRAEAAAPGDPAISRLRRKVYEAEGLPEKATEAADEATERFRRSVMGPRQSERLIVQGRAFLADSRWADADQVLLTALDLDPHNPERLLGVAEAYLLAGLIDKARDVFDRYVETAPGSPYSYFRVGQVFEDVELYEMAANEYIKSLALDPDDEIVHFHLGRVYAKAGRPGRAFDSLKQALRLAPNMREAKDILSKLSE
jgi:two-component system chemotaxis response regulator CheY